MSKSGRKAVAVRHVAFEDLGLLAPILDARGWNVSYCEASTEDLTHRSVCDADLMIVLGGPIGVGDVGDYPFLKAELKVIERRLRRGLPTLGVCLGAQLMAAALGARVYRGPAKEIGWGAVSLTAEGARSALAPLGNGEAQVMHWHGDTFDLPDGALRLAFSALYANQAFSYRQTALALQFHLETGAAELEEWFVGHATELAAEKISVTALREESRRRSATSRTARAVFDGWLDELGYGRERPALAAV